jgi:hypothetical protein
VAPELECALLARAQEVSVPIAASALVSFGALDLPQECFMASVVIAQDSGAVITLLRGSGSNCGAPPPNTSALAQCPSASFCATQAGDVCVVDAAQWREMSASAPASASGLSVVSAQSASAPAQASAPVALLSGLGLVLIGVVIGWMLRRR